MYRVVIVLLSAAVISAQLSGSGENRHPLKNYGFYAWSSVDDENLQLGSCYRTVEYLADKNISQVVATESAFAVRIAATEEENVEFLQRTHSDWGSTADTLHTVITGSRPLATYVVFGDPLYGGVVPAEQLKMVAPVFDADDDHTKDSLGQQEGHLFRANDVCALSDAFIALINKRLVCWGSPKTCTGWQTVTGKDQHINVEKVYCPAKGFAAFPLLSERHPVYGGFLSILGHPDYNFYPPPPKFVRIAALVGEEGLIDVVMNREAVAILFPRNVLETFGNELLGGEVPYSTRIVKKVVANSVGFAAIEHKGSVISWGHFGEGYFPSSKTHRFRYQTGDQEMTPMHNLNSRFLPELTRISTSVPDISTAPSVPDISTAPSVPDISTAPSVPDSSTTLSTSMPETTTEAVKESAQTFELDGPVQTIIASDECFVAILQDRSVATWGGGEDFYCNDAGALDSDVYRPFQSVKNKLTKHVAHVVASSDAFCAIKTDGSLVTWGHHQHGGVLERRNLLLNSATPVDSIRVFPNSGRATCCAFAFVAQDGSAVVWGDPSARVAPADSIDMTRVSKIVATANEFYILDHVGGVFSTLPQRGHGYWSPSNSPQGNMYLPLPVTALLSTKTGVFGVMGRDCVLSDDIAFSPCSNPCGEGVKFRDKPLVAYPLNGYCNEASHEELPCVGIQCQEAKEISTLSSMSFTEILIIVASSLFILLVVFWIIRRFCCSWERHQFNHL